METRVRNKNLLKKVVSPEIAAGAVKSGMNITTTGYLHAGYPQTFFRALAERSKRGEVRDLGIWSACLLGYEVEGAVAEAGALARRLGSHGDPSLRKLINANKVMCNDVRTEMLPQMASLGFFGKLDVAVVHAVAITEEGYIVPSHIPADMASYVQIADTVIVEVDHSLPAELEGMHDIYLPDLPPGKKEIPLFQLTDRIGTPYFLVAEEKIAYVVETANSCKWAPRFSLDENSRRLAGHLIEFLKGEIQNNRLPEKLPPIECGIGTIADAVVRRLAEEDFEDLEIFSGAIGDGAFELLKAGRCRVINTPAVYFSGENWAEFCRDIQKYREKLILRPVEITNHPEMVRRLGLIAINGAIEVDIYGNVNSSHIGGTQLVNGVGGLGVFAANARLSIFTLLSTGKEGDISTIVPMAPHVDQPEHNVDVVVTEQGLADLRGLSPVERAERLINNCAHPDYRPLLCDYLERAKKTVGGHQPHILEEAFSFHQRLKDTGSMVTFGDVV